MHLSSYIYLDISRLIARAGFVVPTGIDRVEFEYADYLLRNAAQRLTFVALTPLEIGRASFWEKASFSVDSVSLRHTYYTLFICI